MYVTHVAFKKEDLKQNSPTCIPTYFSAMPFTFTLPLPFTKFQSPNKLMLRENGLVEKGMSNCKIGF